VDRRRLPLLTVFVAVVTSVLVAVAPLRQSQSCSATTGAGEHSDAVECESSTSSLVEGEGVGVLAVLAVPVALALLGLAWPARSALVAVALLLSMGVVLSGFSIGLFYVPTAVAAWGAATRASPDSPGSVRASRAG
jgi:hypothetical protein